MTTQSHNNLTLLQLIEIKQYRELKTVFTENVTSKSPTDHSNRLVYTRPPYFKVQSQKAGPEIDY